MLHNFCQEMTISTGTSTFTLVEAVNRDRLSDRYAISESFIVSIVHTTLSERMIGVGHLTDANTLVIDSVEQSSNSDSLVSFSAGFKDVIACASADYFNSFSTVNFSGSLAGDVTGTQGATVVTNSSVIAKVLTGFASGSGTVSATDSILAAFQKIVGNIALKMTANSAITAATKTKIAYDVNGLVTSGADATTADIADSTNKRYVTDANLTTIGNTSGTNTGDNTVATALKSATTTINVDASTAPTTGQVLTATAGTTATWQTPAASGVSSVSGTSNRVTSTGGATPIIDISSTLEALLEKVANKDASGGYAGLTLLKLNLRNVANTFTSWFTNTNTAARTYTLPDKDGTVAMTSDITGTNSGTNTGDQTITLTGNVTGSGTGSFTTTIGAGVVTEAMQVLADNTTNNVSTSKHGYVPKATNVGNFLKDDGTWAAPSGSGDMVLASVQSVTGLKTFDSAKAAIKGSSTGVTAIASANASATDYTATLPAATITVAGTDIQQAFTKNQRVTDVSLSVSSNLVAIDASLSNSFTYALQATTGQTFSNPTNLVAGMFFSIHCTQHSSASSTIAFGSYFTEASTGTAASAPTTHSATFEIYCDVIDSTHVKYVLNKAGVA